MPHAEIAGYGASSNTATVSVPAGTETILVETDALTAASFARITVQVIGPGIAEFLFRLYRGAGTGGVALFTGYSGDAIFNLIAEDDTPGTQYTVTAYQTTGTYAVTATVFTDHL